jgi:hypothetical protein
MNTKIIEIEARLGLIVSKQTEGRNMPFTPGAGALEVMASEVRRQYKTWHATVCGYAVHLPNSDKFAARFTRAKISPPSETIFVPTIFGRWETKSSCQASRRRISKCFIKCRSCCEHHTLIPSFTHHLSAIHLLSASQSARI